MAGDIPPKRSCLQTGAEIVRIFLSVLLAILFVVLLSTVLVGRESFIILRQPESYATLANQTHLTTRLRGAVVDTIITSTLNGNPQFSVVNLSKIPAQTWENMAAALLPSNWLDDNYNLLVHTLLTWLNGNSNSLPTLTVDLIPLKEALVSGQGALAIQPLLQTIPVCAQGDILPFDLKTMTTCLPTDVDLSLIAGKIAAMIAAQLPDKFTLPLETLVTPDERQSLEKVRTAFKTIDPALTLGLHLALLLLALYALLQSAYLARLLKHLGWPLYAAGMALLLLGSILFIASRWGADLLTPYLAQITSPIPGFSDLLVDSIRVAGGMLQTPLLTDGIGLLATAVAVQILAYLLVKLGSNRQAVTVEARPPQGIR